MIDFYCFFSCAQKYWIGLLLVACACLAPIAEAAESIVLLLPQSTAGQVAASKAIAQGVKSVLATQVVLVNQDDYPDVASAWKAVMRLRPTAVVGPLHESDVSDLVDLAPKIPVLALNQTAKQHANVWQLAMRTELPVYQLALHLADKGVEKVLLLSRQDAVSQRLHDALLAVSAAEQVDWVRYRESGELAAAASVLLRSRKGRDRVQSLTHLLAQSFHAYPWVRQDADAVIIVAPLADALTLSYQIDYLWGQELSLYWVDSGTNPLSDYVRSATNWGRMKTFMPQYQFAAMTKMPVADGFFQALGQDAGRLLQLRLGRETWDDASVIEGSLGELSMGDNQQVNIKLPLVWLGDGQVDQVDP
jgi:outer membrane PBP1 activator LpoA protein